MKKKLRTTSQRREEILEAGNVLLRETEVKSWRWECKVERANNGYLVTTFIPEDDKYVEERDLFSDRRGPTGIFTGTDTEITSFVEMVWFLAEYFGVLGSKHDKKRFWVGVRDQKGKCLEWDEE